MGSGTQKRTWQYLLDTAISSKKGNFNTPSIFSFLKKKTAALIIISKPPLGRLYSVRRMKTLPPNNGFFYYRCEGCIKGNYNKNKLMGIAIMSTNVCTTIDGKILPFDFLCMIYPNVHPITPAFITPTITSNVGVIPNVVK